MTESADLSGTIEPKSDQMNADDLIAGPRTITVTRVTVSSGKDQPVFIYYQGDNGKPYKPNKSMRRVLVHLWGADGKNYVGKSMTVYRDPRVKWAGKEEGGIRISHLSHISGDTTMPLTETRGKREQYTVKRLAVQERMTLDQALSNITSASDVDALKAVHGALGKHWSDEDKATIAKAIAERKQVLAGRQPGED